MKIKASQLAALEEVRMFTASGDFAGMFTGRSFRRSTALALKDMGLLDSRMMAVTDHNGCIRHNAKWREGFFLTDAGRSALEQKPTPSPIKKVVKSTKKAVSRRTRTSVSVTLFYRCELECGHVEMRSSIGRGGPPEKLKCSKCAASGGQAQ